MPVFELGEELIFPHPLLRDPDGLLAFGGPLTPARIYLAYRWGIFPWYHDDQPVLWWWLCPRLMMRPDEVHISHSLHKRIRKKSFNITINKDFRAVISMCSTIERKGQDGTWITDEMMEAYISLHESGHAISVEVWEEERIVGGLYGVVVGKIFSGESMFSLQSNASKIGFVYLAQYLYRHGFDWIDCQQDTPHMRSMGGRLIGEEEYLQILRGNQKYIASMKL
jgi:leucyl/phenylalanyl-tRNA--protein transferase